MTHHLLHPVGRWTAQRKVAVLHGIYEGQIRLRDAVEAHNLSALELRQWHRHYRARGIAGLYETLFERIADEPL